MYDVIIAGAGPAGSTAAIVSAQAGLRTLLVDRENFPREKACGDAVPATCFRILKDLNVDITASDEFFAVNKVYVKGPRGTNITLALHEQQGMEPSIVSRYVFDRAIYDQALANGAEFCNVSVTGPIVENGQVVGVKAKQGKEEVEYRAKVVIAADGATSSIARALSGAQRSDKHTAIALRGYVESSVELDPTIDLVFLSEVQPGYAWFFPINKHMANIGVGLRSDSYKNQDKTLQDMLDIYLKTPQVKSRMSDKPVTGLKSWQLPLNLLEPPRVYDGPLLAGHPGGFVDPLTCAGIYQAVVTGKRAAEAAIQAIKNNDLSARGLALYDKLWQQDMCAEIKRSANSYRLIGLMSSLIDALLVVARAFPALVPYVLGKI